MPTLPIFPLHAVLLPHTSIHLHVFEPRYRMMMQICLRDEQPFGVALIRQGLEAGGAPADPYPTGCTARITAMEPLQDGRMNISARGEERIRIRSLDRSLPYLTGEVVFWPLPQPAAPELTGGLTVLAQLLKRYQALLPTAPASDLSDQPLDLLYMAAALLHLPPAEKQPLLEAASGRELLLGLLRLYRREIALAKPLLNLTDAARRNTWLN